MSSTNIYEYDIVFGNNWSDAKSKYMIHVMLIYVFLWIIILLLFKMSRTPPLRIFLCILHFKVQAILFLQKLLKRIMVQFKCTKKDMAKGVFNYKWMMCKYVSTSNHINPSRVIFHALHWMGHWAAVCKSELDIFLYFHTWNTIESLNSPN